MQGMQDNSPDMILGRARFVALATVAPMAGLLIYTSEPFWRWVPLLVALTILLVTQLLYRQMHQLPAALPLNAIVVGPSMMTLLTGGLESPFIAVLVVTMAASALVSGPSRAMVLRVCFGCLVIIAAILLPRLPGYVPRMLDSTTELGKQLGPFIWAYVLIAFAIAMATITANTRAALEASKEYGVQLQAQLAEGLRVRNRELTAISGALAHELKNPLAAIQGLATHMARKAEPGTALSEQLTVMVGEIHRMGGIMDHLLDVARPLSDLNLHRVDMTQLASEVVLLHAPMLTAQDAVLTHSGSGAVQADPRKVKQILGNLVLNAFQAGARSIDIVIIDGHTHLQMRVEDDGPGIEGDPQRLFTAGVTDKPEGSGLGLSISLALAQQHGGNLELANRPEGGAVSTLTLPKAGDTP
ncbi:MAG: sensor histidine kinase [Bradymonadia bacterium]